MTKADRDPAGGRVIKDASVIICSRNRAQMLEQTVASILAGSTLPAELVIVDQSQVRNSALAAMAAMDGCVVRYHHVHGVGVSRARNTGIRLARGELVVLTDDDVLVAVDWFDTLTGTLKAGGPQRIVTGQVRPETPSAHTGHTPSTNVDPAPARYRGLIDQDVLYTGNMAMYRSAFQAVGGFDERFGGGARFPAAEDNDLGFRLLSAGYEIVYEPAAMLIHRAWRSKATAFRLAWSYGRGQGGFYAKHLRCHHHFMLRRLRTEVQQRLHRLPRRSLERGWEALSDIGYVLGLVSGFSAWLLRERTD